MQVGDYCNAINYNGTDGTINNIPEFIGKNPSYLTHNFTRETFLSATEDKSLLYYPKRTLADEITGIFTTVMFNETNRLLQFIDLIFHKINSEIMVNINSDLSELNHSILKLNEENTLLIVKGGNIMNIYYNFLKNIADNELTRKTFTDGQSNFKVSDCDFNLYILTKSQIRYNLLYSIIVPYVFKSLKTIQDLFETQFDNVKNDIVIAPIPIPLYIEDDKHNLTIQEITEVDMFITDKDKLVTTYAEFNKNISLLIKAIQYNGTINTYLLYHAINYINILIHYEKLERAIPAIPAIPTNLDNSIEIAFIQDFKIRYNTLLLDRKNELLVLLNESLKIKELKMQNFYTKNKIEDLKTIFFSKRKSDYGNTLVEYKNYMKTGNLECPYGEPIIEKITFNKYENDKDIINANPGATLLDIMAPNQLDYKKKPSLLMVPNMTLNTIDILKIKNNTIPPTIPEYYHYMSMTHITAKFNNSDYIVAFALLRVKLNLEYENDNALVDYNVKKKIYRLKKDFTEYVNPIKSTDQVIAKYSLKMPSEFIDIGITHFTDKTYHHLKDNMREANDCFSCITFGEDKKDYVIGYSSDYIVSDIYKMLWEQTNLPWSDSKYKKRIERIIFMFLFNIVKKKQTNVVLDVEMIELIEIKDDLNRLLTLKTSSEQNPERVNNDEYMRNIRLMMTKYFKNPKIIDDTILKHIKIDLNTIVEANDKYKKYGDFINTILHLIYNMYISITFTIEEIYNFYSIICNRSNFKATPQLESYLGKNSATNYTTFCTAVNLPEKYIVKDMKKYIDDYIVMYSKWITFFNNIIKNKRLLNVLKNETSELSGGGNKKANSKLSGGSSKKANSKLSGGGNKNKNPQNYINEGYNNIKRTRKNSGNGNRTNTRNANNTIDTEEKYIEKYINEIKNISYEPIQLLSKNCELLQNNSSNVFMVDDEIDDDHNYINYE